MINGDRTDRYAAEWPARRSTRVKRLTATGMLPYGIPENPFATDFNRTRLLVTPVLRQAGQEGRAPRAPIILGRWLPQKK